MRLHCSTAVRDAVPTLSRSDQFCIDIVGMLSIGKALQGGDSRWVSSVTIHNELLRRGRRVRHSHTAVAFTEPALSIECIHCHRACTQAAPTYAQQRQRIQSVDGLAPACGVVSAPSYWVKGNAGKAQPFVNPIVSVSQDLVEALAQRNFWIGRTGYLSDQGSRLEDFVPVQVLIIA